MVLDQCVDFTASQNAAIEWRQQDACVMAGPGSGKTTVLVERYRSLIKNHGFQPHEILAITFTEKAAANMKAKIAAQFRHEPEMLREIETAAWISTIHGFCARLLRENAIAAGIDPRFCVQDARESDDMQFDCINTALDEITDTRRTETLALIEALQNPYIAGDLKNAYDAIRSAGKTIAEVRTMPGCAPQATPGEMSERLLGLLANWTGRITPLQQSHRSELREWASSFAGEPPINLSRIPTDRRPELRAFRESYTAWAVDRETAPFRAMIFDVFTRFEDLYRERKTSLGALDFNDLERRAIDLLRAGCRKQFRQVMLDEFQDINDQQMELIDLIRGENVFFAVGDANQSIYGFRHARPQIFKAYRTSIEAAGKHSTDLLDNFRSRAEILQCVETLLNGAQGIEPRQLVAGAAFNAKQEPSIEVLKIQSVDRDEAAGREARWIAHRILAGQFPFRDVAVLCRNGESMRPILEAFNHAGIPYVCGRRQSFLLSREGLDLTALLHTIANPLDGISLTTVLRSPLVGVSDDALLRMKLDRGLDAKLERFFRHLKTWRTEQPVLALDLLIARALSDCGMPVNDNIESFLQLARTRGSDKSLLQFLNEIERMQKAISTESDLSDEDQGDRVQVMTAHAAKGLEFPVTIIAAMDKGTRRSSASITFTPEHGLGIKWTTSGDSWHVANKAVLKEREKEESNRLLYVAMTRAKEHLILSYSCGEKKPDSEWVKLVEGLLQPTLVTDSEPPLIAHYRDPDAEHDVETVPRPALEDQHDSAINVTSLAAFAECPRKYYLERYIGWSASGIDDTPAAELGSMVHEILAGKTGTYTPEAETLAGVFSESHLGKLAATSSRAEREWAFIIDIDGTVVTGTIDLWFEHEGEIHLVDYKTDKAVNAAKYRPQIALYAMALERALGRLPAHASLHFLRKDRVEQLPVDDAAALEVRRLIAHLKAAQHALRFDLNEGEHCRSCQFNRGMCPVAY